LAADVGNGLPTDAILKCFSLRAAFPCRRPGLQYVADLGPA